MNPGRAYHIGGGLRRKDRSKTPESASGYVVHDTISDAGISAATRWQRLTLGKLQLESTPEVVPDGPYKAYVRRILCDGRSEGHLV